MKVALILTGHARTYQQSYSGIDKFLLSQHDVDIYISTWNVDNRGRKQRTSDWTSPLSIEIENYIDLYKPKKVHIEDHDQFYANRFPAIDIWSSTRPDDIFKVNPFAIECGTFFVERMRDQWYIVKKGWELIDNPSEYDIVVRLRSDLDLNYLTLKTGGLVVPNNKVDGMDRGAVCDHMAYGPPELMEKYCKLFDNIEPMYVNDNAPIHHADEMLGVYLRKYCGITPILDRIEYV